MKNHHRMIIVLAIALFVLLVASSMAHAQSFTAEISPGAAGFDTLDSFGLF